MHKALKWTGIGLSSLVGIVVLAGASVYTYGGHLDNRALAAPSGEKPWTPVASTPELVARGQHVAIALGKCVDCHGQDLGGAKFIDDPALGTISAPNLTTGKGGRLPAYDDVALERVLRHGIKVDGRPALIMPSEVFNNLSDQDLAALIAYLRSVPPVDRDPTPKNLKMLARALITFGVVKHGYDQIDQTKAHVSDVAPSSPNYGKYLVDVGGCAGCHGPTLSGGKIPGAPPEFKPAANITPTGIGHYKEADFFRALREGMRPGNVPIDSQMPWRYTKLMTDDEIKSVYAYLKTVPPKDYGNR
jgi:mono/diheme cytochrome c family protein